MEQVKQTAVEWLIEQLKKPYSDKYIMNIIEQAKEMEKQQIINACYEGVDYETSIYENPEQYYNETYGGNK
jgi:hypothetical protein